MVIGFVIAVIWVADLLLFGEREGITKYDDCREIVTLQPDTPQRFYKTFTCSYIKTASGKVIRGVCVHVVNDSGMFSSAHTCATAYVYVKSQDPVCNDRKFPYLGYDDMCHTELQ